MTAKADTPEREAEETSNARKSIYDPRPAASAERAVVKYKVTRVHARALFLTYRHNYRYRHERELTGERGLSDLERERSLIIASVHARCGPRAECLARRRLLGKAARL